ncbi:MAG: glycosyltransferase family 4 protein [Phycisphaeraceae bacterium]
MKSEIRNPKSEIHPLRVMYIARAPFISGAERALVSMLRHLDRARVEPALLVGHETALVDEARRLQIPVAVTPLARREKAGVFLWWRSLRQVGRAIRDFDPHILHANDVPSCQALSVIGGQRKIPRVVHVRWGITASDLAWWACGAGGAECLLCISQWVKSELGSVGATVLAKSRIEVLADAVDWPALLPLPWGEGWGEGSHEVDTASESTLTDDHSSSHPQEFFHVPSPQPSPQGRGGRKTLGFAGQLIESKGLDLVIQAMAKLPASARPRLLVAGEDTQTQGAYKTQLQMLAEQHGVTNDIKWLGFLADVSQLYQQVDVVVCPSRVEPLGLVPLEAAKWSLPTLANRVGGLAETIVEDETGWLIEPTVEAWATVLARLSDTAALRSMGQAARERTCRLYNPMNYTSRLLQLYHDLLIGEK